MKAEIHRKGWETACSGNFIHTAGHDKSFGAARQGSLV